MLVPNPRWGHSATRHRGRPRRCGLPSSRRQHHRRLPLARAACPLASPNSIPLLKPKGLSCLTVGAAFSIERRPGVRSNTTERASRSLAQRSGGPVGAGGLLGSSRYPDAPDRLQSPMRGIAPFISAFWRIPLRPKRVVTEDDGSGPETLSMFLHSEGVRRAIEHQATPRYPERRASGVKTRPTDHPCGDYLACMTIDK